MLFYVTDRANSVAEFAEQGLANALGAEAREVPRLVKRRGTGAFCLEKALGVAHVAQGGRDEGDLFFTEPAELFAQRTALGRHASVARPRVALAPGGLGRRRLAALRGAASAR